MADTARDPQALEREIERTRAELARTVDALVDRVNPKNAARRGVMHLKAEADQLTTAVGALAGSGDDEESARDRGAKVLIGAGAALAATAVVVMAWRRLRR
jgi:predicted dinucleotide-utilizing enzyme